MAVSLLAARVNRCRFVLVFMARSNYVDSTPEAQVDVDLRRRDGAMVLLEFRVARIAVPFDGTLSSRLPVCDRPAV